MPSRCVWDMARSREQDWSRVLSKRDVAVASPRVGVCPAGASRLARAAAGNRMFGPAGSACAGLEWPPGDK